MEKNRENLDEAMKIILENTTDEYIKKMISSIRETPDNKTHITDEMIGKLSQYTYKNYANKERNK